MTGYSANPRKARTMVTTPGQAPSAMFDALTPTQLRNLAKRIYKAIGDVSSVCTILYRTRASRYPDIDVRYHELHRDLCGLHTDLFDAIMARRDESED